MTKIHVIGGGLAGTEAAWQLAERGHEVVLYEMRPKRTTGAHVTNNLAELVCSNSLGSKLPDRASGVLQSEMKLLGSKLIACAEAAAVPAGGALAVDRVVFADEVTSAIEGHPNITLVRDEVTEIPAEPTIIATGPLTSPALSQRIAELTGQQHLYFYDAVSPIVVADTIDMNIAFAASRYGRGDDDYINCPMDKDEYAAFVAAIRSAERAELRDFEREDPHFFEGCVPIEELAARGDDTLAYGPMRPVGLRDPRTGKRPQAVVQLRRDNLAGSLYNIVGFQTNLKWGDQERVLRLIWGKCTAIRSSTHPSSFTRRWPSASAPTCFSLVKSSVSKVMWATWRLVCWPPSTSRVTSKVSRRFFCHRPACWAHWPITSRTPNPSTSSR